MAPEPGPDFFDHAPELEWPDRRIDPDHLRAFGHLALTMIGALMILIALGLC